MSPRLWPRLWPSLLLLIATGALVVLLVFTKSRQRGHVWTTHLVASPALWDWVHGNADDAWRYNSTKLGVAAVMKYIDDAHKGYTSLLDVACNQGYHIGHLESTHPHARHYGTDISSLMAERTRSKCKTCRTAQFDIGELQNRAPDRAPDGGGPDAAASGTAARGPVGFPASYDVVLVSDVLYYISWGTPGFPPGLLSHCPICRRMVRPAQRRWLAAVRRMARDEVVFSDHQDNPTVMEMFQSFEEISYQPGRHVYTMSGTAPRNTGREEEAHQHQHQEEDKEEGVY